VFTVLQYITVFPFAISFEISSAYVSNPGDLEPDENQRYSSKLE
jgi:hypothetical protein